MKRASYRFGVEWIALNDESRERDFETVTGLASVCLIADLFDVSPERVARDVLRIRSKDKVKTPMITEAIDPVRVRLDAMIDDYHASR